MKRAFVLLPYLIVPYLLLGFFYRGANAAAPSVIPFQAMLKDQAGTPVQGPVSVTFRIFTNSTGGTAIWTESQSLSAVNGLVATMLGTGPAPLPAPLPVPAYVSCQVNGDPEMTPRMLLGAVPWALGLPNVYVSSSGNVGIGTTSPRYALDILDDQAVSRLVSTNTVNGSVLELRNDTLINGTLGAINFTRPASGSVAYPGQIAYLQPDALAFRVAGAERVRISSAGNIGVGTDKPGFPLTFANAFGDKVALHTAEDGASTAGFGVLSNLLQIHSDSAASDIAFGYGSSGNFTENIRFTHNGNVGIGVTTPASALSIAREQASVSLSSHNDNGSVLELNNSAGAGTVFVSRGTIRFGRASASSSEIGCDYFGNLTFSNVDQQRMIIAATGQVGIGVVFPQAMLDVNGNVKAWNVTVPSDRRYKEDIRPLTGALEKVEALNGVTYLWNPATFPAKDPPTGRQVGLIAQEVEKVLPEVVSTDQSGYKSLSYQSLVPVLIEAIKEQQKEIEALKAEVKQMKR